jgi:hypothetical protein
MLHAIGLPWPELLGWATVVIEILGGVMILVGAFVPLAPVPMVIVLLVAAFTVHLPNGCSRANQADLVVHAACGCPTHVADLEAEALRRQVRQRKRPILEDCLVDALCLMRMLASIRWSARVKNVMRAALDHVAMSICT